MPALSDSQLLDVARRYQQTQIGIAVRSSLAIGRAWDRWGGLDDVALAAFRDAAAPIAQQAVNASTALTEAYVIQAVSLAGEPLPAAPGVATRGVTIRNGALMSDVYARPTVAARVAVAAGKSFAEAMGIGRSRAVQLADTDPMLAARESACQTMLQIPRVVGYRRVPDGNACEFCLIASTQRYTRGDLMPVHPGCHCTIAPIVGSRDPGHIINRASYDRLKSSGALSQKSLENYLSDTNKVIANHTERASHWRRMARDTTDQEAETRYAKRADEWAAKAEARRARTADYEKRLAAVKAGRLEQLTAVQQHPELGPLLTAA